MEVKIEISNKWDLFYLFRKKTDPFMMTVRYRIFRECTLLAVITGIFSTSSGISPTFAAACRWMAVGCAAAALLAVAADMAGELRTGRLNLVSAFTIVFLLAFAGMILFFPW